MHVKNAARFLLGAASVSVAVCVGAVVVDDDGAAGADELVHLAPGAYPGGDAECAELADGTFKACDEHAQQLFTVDLLTDDVFECRDFAIEVRVVAWLAVDVDADSHGK